MATGVRSWSLTAASNATADSTINFAEGQAPSSLNDSNRAMMASVKKYADDVGCTLATGGSATTYTLTTNQGYTLVNGTMVGFTMHVGNSGTCTLNVDSLGAQPLRFASGVEIPAGGLITSTPYLAVYRLATTEWIIVGSSATAYVPIGTVLPYSGSSAPNSSFALLNAAAISRTTYATLFTLIGATYGTGDGLTTFNLPGAATLGGTLTGIIRVI